MIITLKKFLMHIVQNMNHQIGKESLMINMTTGILVRALTHLKIHQRDIEAVLLLQEQIRKAHVVNTEVIIGAVVEAEITALPIHQVIGKKVAMIEVMILVQEGIFQEMIITLAAVRQEAVLHLPQIQDMQAKSAKTFKITKT